MNRDDRSQPAIPDPTPAPNGQGNSGEGANTALQELIKKRKLQANDSDVGGAPPSRRNPEAP